MALAALANALTGDAISSCFENIPEARALSLLLEEKPSARVKALFPAWTLPSPRR